VSFQQGATSTNGRESAIECFLYSIEMPDAGAATYLAEHIRRLVRTLAMLPLGTPETRALELGSYLQMAATMERVLGYGSVRPAYYGADAGIDTKTLLIKGQSPFRSEIDVFDAEVDTYPYADGSFDVVLCCELIEHLIHDPMHMLVECWRVLKGNGLFVLTTPNTVSLSSVAAALNGRHNPQVFSRYPAKGNQDIPHVREYTPFEIVQALQSAGFEIQTLITERMPKCEHATWVIDLLRQNKFETSLRGEQIYCLSRKRSGGVLERFPAFLYSS
jgi:SAM-dependent methyltransferase